MSRLLPLLPLLLLAACNPDGRAVRLSGAETTAGSTGVAIVPAAVFSTSKGWQMELVSANGTVLAGLLQEVREPVIVPLAAPGAAPLVGGGTVLTGGIAGGTISMQCRLRLLNPVRGADGGGSGRCEGDGRQVEFIF
jgi:hypothetical protein